MKYLLNIADPGWWKRIKIHAAKEGKSIRKIICDLLTGWLKGEFKI